MAFYLRLSHATNDRRAQKDQPRLFVSISRDPTLCLSANDRLHVQLFYQTEHSSKPIAFSKSATLIDSATGFEGQYNFLKDGTNTPEYAIELKRSNRRPRQVSIENGFSTIYAGEKIASDVLIDAAGTYGLQSGKQYQVELT